MTTIRDNVEAGRYELVDGDEVGVIAEYERREGSITFTHTETLPGHQGKGLAKPLVLAALDAARAAGLDVYPSCPYVRKVIADHAADYLSLVPTAVRTKFGLPEA